MASDRITLREIRYAKGIARAYSRKLPWLADDLEGAALLGLTKAAANFREGAGDFRCYSRQRILGEVLDELRSHDHLKRSHRALVRQGEAPDLFPVSYVSRYHEPSAPEADLGDPTDVDALLAALPPRLEFVARRRFLEEMPYADIGRRLRPPVTESRACQLVMTALRRLQKIQRLRSRFEPS